MTRCMECGKPWGVMLDKGEEPTEAKRDAAIRELHETWLDDAYCDTERGEDATFDLTLLPHVYVTQVVWLTEGVIDFASEHLNCDVYVDGPCWIEERYAEMPAWLLRGRPRRWAYRWDCCSIKYASEYLRPPEPATS